MECLFSKRKLVFLLRNFLLLGQKWWKKFTQAKIEKKDDQKFEQNRPASSNKSKIKDSKVTQPKSNIISKPIAKKNPVQPIVKNSSSSKTSQKNTHECKPQKTMLENSQPEKQVIKPADDNVEVKLEKNDQKVEIKNHINKSILFNQCQLYLARVNSRLKQYETAKEFYLKVIEREPKVILKKLKLKN